MSIAVFENGPALETRLTAALPGRPIDLYPEPLDRTCPLKSDDYEIIIITPNTRIKTPILDRLPALKLVVTTSTGFDHIDLPACREKGVRVSNIPSWAENAVAEWVFALLLGFIRKIWAMRRKTKTGAFSLEGLEGGELFGRTMGVIGLGLIGQRVAAIAAGFGMKVLACDTRPDPALAERIGCRYVELEELLGRSDVVSLHAPLTRETSGLIGPDRIELFKPGAVLVNAARGELVDSAALLKGLTSGRIGGAVLDVVQGLDSVGLTGQDPGVTDQTLKTLLSREDVVFSPHLAWYTGEALERVFATTVENIVCFCNGEPENIVS